MRAVDIIVKKRDGEELSRDEIDYFIQGFTNGDIPDHQASALAMAILLKGMTPAETTELTLAMAHSGQVLDFSSVVDIAVDKHSSGGVGDKTTLAVLPMVAACGLPVGKMSGRGLGYSGGTLDKVEAIPGYRVDLSLEEFQTQFKSKGLVLSGQSMDLAPADGKLYALRDVTGTVPAAPLIASSIMCKKIAAGAQAVLLDVKMGRGAFMGTVEEARELADLMVDIGRLAKIETIAIIADMNQPLGHAVGNSLEVLEAIETLQGGGPADFREHCLHSSALMLVLGKRAGDLETGRKMAERSLADGTAFEKFRMLVTAQGGDVSYVDHPEKFPRAAIIETVKAPRSGWLAQIDARAVGEASVSLGAGRAQKGDPVDHAVGFVIHHKVGDRVEAGEALFTIHANHAGVFAEIRDGVAQAHVIVDAPVPPLPLFYD